MIVLPRRAKSRIRKLYESWAEGTVPQPAFLDAGIVFIYPSHTDPKAQYIVAKLMDRKSGNEYWVCGCKGFRFDHDDSCVHVTDISNQMEELRAEESVRPKRKRKQPKDQGSRSKVPARSKRTPKKKVR